MTDCSYFYYCKLLLRHKTQRGPIHEANQTWYYFEPLLF